MENLKTILTTLLLFAGSVAWLALTLPLTGLN